MPQNRRKKSRLFSTKRYWYHVSTTIKENELTLFPREDGDNRSGYEPPGKRICVAPTVEQCITAIPYCLSEECNIYRTKNKVRASAPEDVFDMNITDEGWLEIPTRFVKVGTLNFEDIEEGLDVESVVEEAASDGERRHSRKVLNWWKKAQIKRFIKYA